MSFSNADLSVRKLIPTLNVPKTSKDLLTELLTGVSPSKGQKKKFTPARPRNKEIKVLQTMVDNIHNQNNANKGKSVVPHEEMQ